MKLAKTFFLLIILSFSQIVYARDCKLPDAWQDLCHILENRVYQKSPKMKLTETEVEEFESFLNAKKFDFTQAQELKQFLPKTTIELIMSVKFRKLDYAQTELIASFAGGNIHGDDVKLIKNKNALRSII